MRHGGKFDMCHGGKSATETCALVFLKIDMRHQDHPSRAPNMQKESDMQGRIQEFTKGGGGRAILQFWPRIIH